MKYMQVAADSFSALFCYSTMGPGKPDLINCHLADTRDYPAILAESLEVAMRKAIKAAAGEEPEEENESIFHKSYIKAKEWFISSYPLLGSIAADFEIIADSGIVGRKNISVAAISPQMKEIYVNPNTRLTQEEWRFVLAHELLHAALRHDVRCGDRDPYLWNIACDYVINGWLVEMQVGNMPENVLYHRAFCEFSAESVYDMIVSDISYHRLQSGDILYDEDGFWDRLEGEELDRQLRSALHQGLTYHEEYHRGFLPGDFIEEVRAISRPPIPWDVALGQWFDEHFSPVEPHRTYARASRRQSSTPDIPRPAWQKDSRENSQIFGVVLDTSGSMERHILAVALGSIASYSFARDVHHVRLVFCDAAAYDQGIVSPEEIADRMQLRGRGGTRLQPGIDLLIEDPVFPKNAPILIITDGGCERLNLKGREHAYLIPSGRKLPFTPKGPVFRMK